METNKTPDKSIKTGGTITDESKTTEMDMPDKDLVQKDGEKEKPKPETRKSMTRKPGTASNRTKKRQTTSTKGNTEQVVKDAASVVVEDRTDRKKKPEILDRRLQKKQKKLTGQREAVILKDKKEAGRIKQKEELINNLDQVINEASLINISKKHMKALKKIKTRASGELKKSVKKVRKIKDKLNKLDEKITRLSEKSK